MIEDQDMSQQTEIKHALERAAKTVSIKPAFGQRTYTNVATVSDRLTCIISEHECAIVADVPKGMGGEHKGPSPSALFRSAISSCTAIGFKMWAARRDVAVRHVQVTVETDVDARGQLCDCRAARPGFEAIRLSVEVDADADLAVLDSVLEVALDHSPMIDAIGGRQAVEVSLLVLTPQS